MLADASGSIAVVLAPQRPPAPPALPPGWPLTPAERRVVELLLAGQANRQIAAALFVSENTVQTHLRHVFGKLGVRSRTEILARFFRETYGAAEQSDPGGLNVRG